jgi:hypothetical protein
MALSWPSWVRSKAAPSDELASQLEAATAEHSAASGALDAAKREFEDTGSEKAGKSLLAAKERLELADAHFGRAQRLMHERLESDRQAERARLRAEIVEMRAKAEEALNEEAPLIEREGELLAEVLVLRDRRWRVRLGANQWVRHVNRLLLQLGEQPEERVVRTQPTYHGVRDVIRSRIEGLVPQRLTGEKDPRQTLLDGVLPLADHYALDTHGSMIGWDELPPITAPLKVRNL